MPVATWGHLAEVSFDNLVKNIDTDVGAKTVKADGASEPAFEFIERGASVSSGGKGQMDGGV